MCLPYFFLPPPTSHTIAIFPSFLYLFSHPRFPEIVQRRRLYILFSYCDTWRAFCDYQFRSCRSSMLCVFLGGFIWEKCWKFSQLLFSICASVCVFCVVPHFHLTRNISLLILQFTRVSHVYEEKQKLFCHRGRICLRINEGIFDWATLAGWQIASSYSFPQSCGRFGNGCETCWPSSPVFTCLVMTCITSLLWLLHFSIIFP